MLDKKMEKEFKENKKELIEKAKLALEEAEEVQLVITENSLLANGGAVSLLACVCCLLEKLNRSGLPSDVIEKAVKEATSGKSDKEQIQELFEKLIDRL